MNGSFLCAVKRRRTLAAWAGDALLSLGLIQLLGLSTASAATGQFLSADIGNSSLAGTVETLTDGFKIVAGGRDIGDKADQFHYTYQERTGNFDVQVRLQSLNLTDSWAKAGLMARASLATNSQFAAALATPSLSGCFFESRTAVGAAASYAGSVAANYPNTWLRLQRSGSVFTGYASFDGQAWTLLGSANLALANTIQVGLAVASHNTNRVVTAELHDLENTASQRLATPSPSVNEPLGPSSRKTGLVISEIMYNFGARTDGKVVEFVELYNSQPYFEDLSGYRIGGSVDYTFPPGTIFPGGGFLVVAKAPADIQSAYGITNVFGGYTNALPPGGGTVRLLNRSGAVLLEINYSDKGGWPLGADGTGHSLVLARPSYGEDDPRAWEASERVGGSPGRAETIQPDPLRSVMINEFLAHQGQEVVGFVELHNHGNQDVDLSGCRLSTSPSGPDFVVPSRTMIPARGFMVFNRDQLGFGLSEKGETVYFYDPDRARLIDVVHFESQSAGISMGRFPDGASNFYPLVSPTPGTNNNAIVANDVVINEIMYAPLSEDSADQYIELYNQGTNAVDISDWRFTAGIKFTIPQHVVMAPGAYLVVAQNAAHLMTLYPNLHSGNTVGDFQGKLSKNGERLVLARPEQVVSKDNNNQLITNKVEIVVDEVTYGTGGRWGEWAKGGGSSLELIDPRSNHRLASNWGDSDETGKSQWITIEHTGVLDNGSGSANSLQIMLLGGGECLVDDVEVRVGAGTNLVLNGDFEGGLTNWVAQGTHVRSSLESNGGSNNSRCLHIRASEEGDPGANRIRTRLGRALSAGQTATIRARVRWLRGFPEILFRLYGNYLEATGNILTTHALGTPGGPNSRATPNAGPAIYEVGHFPLLPLDRQAVVVSARVHDPDGVQSLVLNYRLDPATTYTAVAMVDDGTSGDAVAGDGIFSATIPGQPAGKLAAFYLRAMDKYSPPATTLFPDNAPVRECLVRFGDPQPTSSFGTYRLWLTQKTVDTWTHREVLSHEPLDGTFVYANTRVIYNMTGRYSGSPWHQSYSSPMGSPCQYTFQMPEDDQVLGTTSFNKIHSPGNNPGDDPTIQTEQTAYWMVGQLGLPFNYKRYVICYVNGNRRGTLMEDTQVPAGDVLKEHFPDDPDGDLYKLYGWYEFGDNGSSFTFINWATLQEFRTTGGAKKVARYRWNWRPRAVKGSANDFTNLFALVDAVNTPTGGAYLQNIQAHLDPEEWMRTFAINHATGNWDSYGNNNGQNTYAYKPTRDRWHLLLWDYNIVLGNSGSNGPTGDNLFQTGDPLVTTMYNTWPLRRMYWRAMRQIVDGPMNLDNVSPLMDAKYAAFQANGIAVSSPSSIKSWIRSRRTYLTSQLNTVAAPFAVTSNNGTDFDSGSKLTTLTGTAPIEVSTIMVNGVEYPLTWTAVKNWRVTLSLQSAGPNLLVVQGFDSLGNALANATSTITVSYTGSDLPPALRFEQVEVLVNGQVRLTWAAETGKTYRVQYKDSLDNSNWLNLIPEVTATGSTAGILDLAAQPERFYRVLKLN